MNRGISSIQRVMADLRRRKVFRSAAAYGVAAWLVVAVADVVVPVLRLPEWTMNLVILLAIAGLPIAVVFSWLFDLSPDGVVRTPSGAHEDTVSDESSAVAVYAVIGLVALLAGFLVWRPFSAVEGPRSIAVLPFSDFSEQNDAGYLGDGIAEELLNALVGVDGLRVAARTSSFAFKGLNEDVRSIGQKLDVDTVLEGSVRRAGERVRITAQLIDVRDGFHLWSETYDRELNDIFRIQDEIAVAIVDALKVRLGAGEDERMARHADTSFEAYDLYLLGRHHWHQRTPASLQRAVELFNEAVSTDPDFALAYSGLADAYLLLRDYGDMDVEQAQAMAESAIATALRLDDKLAEPYASLGLLRMSRSEFTGAELAFRNAIELDASYSMAHMWLGLVLDNTQGPGAAYAEYRAAHRSDPLHPVVNGNLASALARMGRYDDARTYLQQSEQAHPETAKLRLHLSWLDAYYGRFDESVNWALAAATGAEGDKTRSLLAKNFASMGDTARAESFLNTVDPVTEPAQDFNARAQVLFAGGQYERVLALARARMGRLEVGAKPGGEPAWAGAAQFALSDYAGAIAELDPFLEQARTEELDPPTRVDLLAILAYAYGKVGNNERRDEIIQRSLEVHRQGAARGWDSPDFHAAVSGVHAVSGNVEQALRSLSRAVEAGWRETRWIDIDPRFDELRAHPDFRSLADRVLADISNMHARAVEIVDEKLTARL